MRLGHKDRRVIEAFIRRESSEGRGDKLSTDGVRLDGLWMGGGNIAEWDGGSIAFNDLGSRAAQTVQDAVRRAAKIKHQNPTFWITGALKNHKRGSLHRAAHVPMGETIPLSELEHLAHSRNARTRKRAVLARTLRGFRRRK